ncbi:MAG TPA: S-methyl-5'-thioadenosine phosphorylase [Candidatus Hydrogenedentes bacterium]|nr:S-methyl-5'-thioadenosine phosphorylase [Candidatus Hydrogenedentota bacterium]HOL76844.1 S-methyl-5'-thioadenosine phosphorylase [Candidatus Hydrogenedentota bacterium]HPO86214.1 S-methyl-5'-thioadenosine phosphorylase [Candidatus Hydrogenedentota bacterium]
MEKIHKKPLFGVIGGSGLYEIKALTNRRWVHVDSPFGAASDDLLFGELHGEEIVFLPRHGRGHRIPPSRINYRANIDVLKRVGVESIVSVSAVGSLKEDLHPGDFVLVDQFIDRTFAREKSFFDVGLVAHVSMAQPVCSFLGNALAKAAEGLGMRFVRGGTYLTMEGPQFSTRAESLLYRQWGCDVIGMTNMPEAKLAREAELCYATVAMVTDYDCWHESHEAVSVDQIVAVLRRNAEHAGALIVNLVEVLKSCADTCVAGCRSALDNAIITPPEARDPEMVKKLDAVAGRVLRRG